MIFCCFCSGPFQNSPRRNSNPSDALSSSHQMHGLCFAAVPLCVKWRNNGPGKLSFGPTTLNRRSSLKATGVGKGKPKTNLLFSKRPEIDSSTLRVLECFFPPLENKNHEDFLFISGRSVYDGWLYSRACEGCNRNARDGKWNFTPCS